MPATYSGKNMLVTFVFLFKVIHLIFFFSVFRCLKWSYINSAVVWLNIKVDDVTLQFHFFFFRYSRIISLENITHFSI